MIFKEENTGMKYSIKQLPNVFETISPDTFLYILYSKIIEIKGVLINANRIKSRNVYAFINKC